MSAPFEQVDYIWKDGEIVAWDDARIHVMSHVIHYGSSVFEGVRCYETPDGPAIFRLDAHFRRFEDSHRIHRMRLSHSRDDLVRACHDLIRQNGLTECYLRPISLRGFGAVGVDPQGSPVETFIICWPWGAYLGDDALEKGVDACVSTWHRPAPNTFPAMAKAGGNYINAALMKMEAHENGYAEAIALGPEGLVSEGSGQNLFLVRDGVLRTPPLDGTLLGGITRDSVLRIAEDEGIPVRKCPIPREALYTADELFFTGTAAEVTPVRSVDRIEVGAGRPGPMTRRLQSALLGIARGERADAHGWLDRVKTSGATVEVS